jgi:hypothetical protein
MVACCAQNVEDAWPQERVVECLRSCHVGLLVVAGRTTQGQGMIDVESFMASMSRRLEAVDV